MNRIVKWLKHKLERVVLLDDVVVDNLSLKIVERHYRVFFKSTRSIEDSFGGWLSGIYIDKKECHQPFLSKIQQLILQWSKASEHIQRKPEHSCPASKFPQSVHPEPDAPWCPRQGQSRTVQRPAVHGTGNKSASAGRQPSSWQESARSRRHGIRKYPG